MTVEASNAAAAAFTRPRIATPPPARARPNANASERETRPRGSGRPAVRVIAASRSASYHMLRAPAPPAPAAMHNSAMQPVKASRRPGATAKPTMAVNITSDITRGFVSARKSPIRAAPRRGAATAPESMLASMTDTGTHPAQCNICAGMAIMLACRLAMIQHDRNARRPQQVRLRHDKGTDRRQDREPKPYRVGEEIGRRLLLFDAGGPITKQAGAAIHHGTPIR